MLSLMAFFRRHPKGIPFKVSPEHFPLATRDLIPAEVMVRLGILALGFRGEKVLNVGVLDMSQRAHMKEVEATLTQILGDKKLSFRFYRVSPEDFERVMSSLYGIQVSTTSQSSART